MRPFYLSVMVGLIALAATAGAAGAPVSQIIPAPQKLEFTAGMFQLQPGCHILLSEAGNPDLAFAGQTLAQLINKSSGWKLQPGAGQASKGDIELTLTGAPAALGNEGYQLAVTPERIVIRANKPAGIFYGVQTLRQLLPAQIESPRPVKSRVKGWSVPCVRIEDAPRFAWRGMLLDVARHFFPKEFIYKYIDGLAMNKFNSLQLHLTDDQGWRIEIKRYPRLTQVGAWCADRTGIPWRECKPQAPGEKATYGGFYTQDEIRAIIAYAKARFITIVPEIEMPGHSRAALAAYPEYLCSRQALPVAAFGGGSGNNAWCPGREGTFEFLDNVLNEVIDLFPSPFIHIGGDECNKSGWKACADCQARMRAEGLKTEEELQSYFVRRIEKHINARGRRLIGWDEILEGGLPPNATVMSWRGIKGGIAASKAGHDVVMSPTTWVYFDYYQGQKALEPEAIGGYLPLTRIYQWNPVPDELTAEEARHVLGGQANVWAEYIATPSHAEYMTYPRALALSEDLWSNPAGKNWPDFSRRLEAQFVRLDLRGINYAKSAYDVKIEAKPDKAAGQTVATLSAEMENQDIRYTTDGSEPTAKSPRYTAPLKLKGSATLKAATFKKGKRFSRVSIQDVKVP